MEGLDLKRALLVSVLVVACLMLTGAASAEPWHELDRGWYNLSNFQELTGITIAEFGEAPMLAERVASGELPPVSERLPKNPLVMAPWNEIGEYGGTLRWMDYNIDFDEYLRFLSSTQLVYLPIDTPFSTGMGPWVGPIQPGVLEAFEMSDDGTVFTLWLREGMRWSDGAPLTTADVDFQLNHVLTHEDIVATAPEWMRHGYPPGEVTTEIEIVDDYQFKVIFSEPNPTFMYLIRNRGHLANHAFMFMAPRHYLEQFHKDFTSIDEILPIMEAEGFFGEDEWGNYYSAIAGPYGPSGQQAVSLADYAVGYPTLAPYIAVEAREDGTMIFERNPYYYMVDPDGNQLPYIDRLRRNYAADREMVNMAIISGQTDLQTELSVDDFPLFAQNRDRGNYVLSTVPVGIRNTQYLIFFINMAHEDEDIRPILGDVRYRKALSLALDREQFKEAIFYGFGEPAQMYPMSVSPFYIEGANYEQAYAEYDPEAAKALLDEMGLVDTTGDGWRNLPNGDAFLFNFEFFIIGPYTVPGVELAERYWRDIGVRVIPTQVDGSYFWALHGANEHMVGTWWGHGEDPTDGSHIGLGINTPEWRRWHTTGGEEGIEPDDWAKELLELQDQFERALTRDEAHAIGREIWRIQAEWLPLIGTVTDPMIAMMWSQDLENVYKSEQVETETYNVVPGSMGWFFSNPDRR